MALISKIREKSGFTVIIIGLGVVLFLVGRELLTLIPAGSKSKTNPMVGKVAGENITRKSYQNQIEQLRHNFMAQYNRMPTEADAGFLQDQAWQQLIEKVIYEKLYDKLGIDVSEEELVDMVQGEHIHPDLKAAFTDPKTQEFDKKQLLSYLQKLGQMSNMQQAHWHDVERQLAQNRCQQKFDQLMRKSVFVSDLEASKQHGMNQTTLDLKYLFVPYDQLSDESYTITDDMLKQYLKTHEKAYQAEERKDIAYLTFPVHPTEEDKKLLQEELQTIKQGFIQTEADSDFASIHTDDNPNAVSQTFTSDQLPQALASEKAQLKNGQVIGPVETGKQYKLYKVVNINIQGKQDKTYEVAIITKNLLPGDEAREQAFKKADDFVHTVSNQKQFTVQAEQDNISIRNAQVKPNDTRVGMLSSARELVRWVYNEASVGKISPVFELGDHYVVAVMTQHIKPGLEDLTHVKETIRRKVLHEQKADTIKKQLAEKAADLSLDEVATQYGSGAQVLTTDKVKFMQSSLQSAGKAADAIGQAFALSQGQRTEPVAADRGVVVIEVVGRQEEASAEGLEETKASQLQMEQFKQSYYIPKALEKLNHTQDMRYRHY